MKPTLILLALLAALLSPSSSTAQQQQQQEQVPDFASCERCVNAHGCPNDFNSCSQNCQRPIDPGLIVNQTQTPPQAPTPPQGQTAAQAQIAAEAQAAAARAAAAKVATLIQNCVEECGHQLDRCLDVARLDCASIRECL